MRIFISPLTFYTYEDTESSKELNKEESQKFVEGMRNAGKYDRILIFSSYSLEEFKELVETHQPSEGFEEIISTIQSSDFKWIKTDLVHYDKTYKKAYEIMEDILSSWEERDNENMEVSMNLSCGHKIGALALYMAVLNLVHEKYYGYLSRKKGKMLRIRPYHAERGIVEELPVMNFENESHREYERYLGYLSKPMDIGKFKSLLRKEEPSIKNFGDKVIMYLSKRGYIYSKNGKIGITEKGRTLYYVLKKINEI